MKLLNNNKMNILRKFRASLRLTEAIRQANEAHKETGARYYVMPANGTNGRLFIIDRDNFRKLKQKGHITHEATVADLEKECFYCTPYRNGEGSLPDSVARLKRKEYFKWVDKTEKNHGKIRKH